MALFLLREPIEFDAVDGEPVKTLFVVVSPTIPLHLRLLARLGQVLQDPELRTLLRSGGASADAVLGRIRTLEALHAGTSR